MRHPHELDKDETAVLALTPHQSGAVRNKGSLSPWGAVIVTAVLRWNVWVRMKG